MIDCEHEGLTEDRNECLDCGMVFVLCRACSNEEDMLGVYHGEPECPYTERSEFIDYERIRARGSR